MQYDNIYCDMRISIGFAASHAKQGAGRWFGVGQALTEARFKRAWPENDTVCHPVPEGMSILPLLSSGLLFISLKCKL